MADTAVVALGSAVFGALVGGAATAVGTYYVGASERRHSARTGIYLVILPEYRNAPAFTIKPSGGIRTKQGVLDDLLRSAVVAGKDCYRRAAEVQVAHERRYPELGMDVDPSDPVPDDPDQDVKQRALDEAVDELDRWLAKKLRYAARFPALTALRSLRSIPAQIPCRSGP